MAVVQRPSTHRFIQQYQAVRKRQVERAAKSFNDAVPPALNPRPFSFSSAKNPAAVPYDPASKRRVAMALVDLCTVYIEGLWPNQQCRLPLRKFVFEILRRSRAQYPVFQVALCYMARLQPVIKAYTDKNAPIPPKLACGRRTLVAALQVASKFLQDRCYSAKVWARISGLPLEDLKQNELALMEALDWNMFVSYEAYIRSCQRLRVTVDSAFVDSACKADPSTPLSSPAVSPMSTLTSTPTSSFTSIPTPDASPAPMTLPHSPEVEIWTNY